MPVYCYASDDGKTVEERSYPMGKAPKRIRLANGEWGRRSFVHENAAVPATKGWPFECIASGVHASQAADLRAYFAQHGVPTEVTSDGNPIYRDRHHRRRALAVRGMHDRASFN